MQEHQASQTEQNSAAAQIRTINLETTRHDTSKRERTDHEEDERIETQTRASGNEAKILAGVIIAAILLCLLGLAITLTSTPPPPTLH